MTGWQNQIAGYNTFANGTHMFPRISRSNNRYGAIFVLQHLFNHNDSIKRMFDFVAGIHIHKIGILF